FNVFQMPDYENVIKRLQSAFGDDLYVELTPINTPLYDTLNAKAIKAIELFSAQPLATYPTFYKEGDDADTVEVIKAIAENSQMSKSYRPKQFVRDFAFHEPAALRQRVIDAAKRVAKWNGIADPTVWANSLRNVDELAQKCE